MVGMLLFSLPAAGRLKSDKHIANLYPRDQEIRSFRHDLSRCLPPVLRYLRRRTVVPDGITNHAIPVAVILAGIYRMSGCKNLFKLPGSQCAGGIALLNQTLQNPADGYKRIQKRPSKQVCFSRRIVVAENRYFLFAIRLLPQSKITAHTQCQAFQTFLNGDQIIRLHIMFGIILILNHCANRQKIDCTVHLREHHRDQRLGGCTAGYRFLPILLRSAGQEEWMQVRCINPFQKCRSQIRFSAHRPGSQAEGHAVEYQRNRLPGRIFQVSAQLRLIFR